MRVFLRSVPVPRKQQSTTSSLMRLGQDCIVLVRRFTFDFYRILFGYDVFISYSSHNAAYAEALEKGLSAFRFRVFRDATGIESSALLVGLLRIPRRSRAIIVLLTTDAVKSAWVAAEVVAHAGAPGTCRIIPILPDPSVLLSNYSDIDLSYKDAEFLNVISQQRLDLWKSDHGCSQIGCFHIGKNSSVKPMTKNRFHLAFVRR